MVEENCVNRLFCDIYWETICSNKFSECAVFEGSVLAGKTGIAKNKNSPN